MAKTSEYQRWQRDIHQLAEAAQSNLAKDRVESDRLGREGADPLSRVAQALMSLDTARNYCYALARAAEMLPMTPDDPTLVATVSEVKKIVYEPKDQSTSLQMDFRMSSESIGVLAEAAKRTLVMELYLLQPKMPEGEQEQESDEDRLL